MTEFENEKDLDLKWQVKLTCCSNFSSEKALEC